MRSGRTTHETPYFHPRHPPTLLEWPSQKQRGSGLIASAPVSDVSAPVNKNGGMAPSAACDCGTEEQIVDHVVLQCPIHRPPHGLHGLTVLDDGTIEWLLNACPEMLCDQAVDSNNWLKRRRRSLKNSESKSIIVCFIGKLVSWQTLYFRNFCGLQL